MQKLKHEEDVLKSRCIHFRRCHCFLALISISWIILEIWTRQYSMMMLHLALLASSLLNIIVIMRYINQTSLEEMRDRVQMTLNSLSLIHMIICILTHIPMCLVFQKMTITPCVFILVALLPMIVFEPKDVHLMIPVQILCFGCMLLVRFVPLESIPILRNFYKTSPYMMNVDILACFSIFSIIMVLVHYLNQQYVLRSIELISMMNLKDSFISKVSHEIRTPLFGILGYAFELRKENLSEEQKNKAQVIENCANDILRIVNDILDFNKMRTDGFVLKKNCFDLPKMIKDTLTMHSASLKEKLLKFVHKSDELPKYVIGDELRLKQIIMNLMSNAIKYTHKGSITVKTSTANYNGDNFNFIFEIKDTGIGIKEGEISNLFLPFRQVHEENTGQASTGLGLAISKVLVNMMGFVKHIKI